MITPQKQILDSFKVILLGAGGTGKTSLLNRYCYNSFDANSKLTVGTNFSTSYINIKFRNSTSDVSYKYIVDSIFDCGGQKRFRQLIPKMLKGADGVFLVFDLVSYSSFHQLNYWYDLLNTSVSDSIPILLIGTKSDLLNNSHPEAVREDLIMKFMNEHDLNGFFKTSALENHNVLKVFNELNQLMLDYHNYNAVIV
ncbi:MAG: GTP-binding protein [Promethearchaeota archaeon]|nr:MAG: GTP-binding protein [Candidatus Lokiarchaeota archaeon]